MKGKKKQKQNDGIQQQKAEVMAAASETLTENAQRTTQTPTTTSELRNVKENAQTHSPPVHTKKG